MRNKRGFSLVEVLVAVVIFALLLVGLMSVAIAGNKNVIHARDRAVAAQLGRFFLDPLQGDVRLDTWDQAGNQLRIGTSAGVAQSFNNRSFAEALTVTTVPNTGNDLRRVVTSITWTEAP